MNDTVRVHVWVRGRVQGVGFRAYTEAMARSAGVHGWVRNLRDGRVEAVFEGSPAAVEAMLRWCQQGSPGSRVEGVEHRSEPPEGLSTFEIRPTV
ncbi:acylphosphatase [Synechococcus sp. H65.1]|uniref:acylphosphatase n=1 Tax=unclassified Synechococcus TaxID=2626047 RepID=UPI0039C36D90